MRLPLGLLLGAGLLPALALAQFHLYFLPGLQVPGQVPGPVPGPVAASEPQEEPPRGAGALREVYAWRQMDFEFESPAARQQALASGAFDPAGTLPLGGGGGGGGGGGEAGGGALAWRALLLVLSAQMALLYLLLSAVVALAAYLLVACLLHLALYTLDGPAHITSQ